MKFTMNTDVLEDRINRLESGYDKAGCKRLLRIMDNRVLNREALERLAMAICRMIRLSELQETARMSGKYSQQRRLTKNGE